MLSIFACIIIIILSCHQPGYPWPSLATPPYRSSLLAGPQGYIPYPLRAAVCRFELVPLVLLGHVRGSIGEHHLWARPFFSSSVLYVLFVVLCFYSKIMSFSPKVSLSYLSWFYRVQYRQFFSCIIHTVVFLPIYVSLSYFMLIMHLMAATIIPSLFTVVLQFLYWCFYATLTAGEFSPFFSWHI